MISVRQQNHIKLDILIVFIAAMLYQFFHMIEHVVQAYQHWWLGRSIAESSGVLFFLNLEWNHFLFNLGYFIALAYLVFRFTSNSTILRPTLHRISEIIALLWVAVLIQGYHVFEHSIRIVEHLHNNCEPCKDVLTWGFDGVYWHLTINAIVFFLAFIALMFIGPIFKQYASRLLRLNDSLAKIGYLSIGVLLGVSASAILILFVKTSATTPRVNGGGIEYLWPVYPGGIRLRSYFSFSNNFFNCAVDTNEEPIVMHTKDMGLAKLPPNNFYMNVTSLKVYRVDYSSVTNGGKRATLYGKARSVTRVGPVNKPMMVADEVVPFMAVVSDLGFGGKNDSSWLTLFFNEKDSPKQLAIFGHDAKFGGEIVSGDISINY